MLEWYETKITKEEIMKTKTKFEYMKELHNLKQQFGDRLWFI